MNKKFKIIYITCGVLLVTLIIAGIVLNKTAKASSEEPEVLQKMSESDITAEKKKINIYIFWGNGCSHCKALGEFFESIESDYGKYYNLYTFEVWYDTDNQALMSEMAAYFDETPTGVPYFIIGDQSFSGYSTSSDDKIKQAIVDEYNSDSRTDVYQIINN